MKGMLLLVISLAALIGSAFAVNVDRCGTLSAPGTYTLIRNVNAQANAVCFAVAAKNVSIDCQNFAIMGSNSKAAVYSNSPSTTVKNCKISGFLVGIAFDNATGGSVETSVIDINGTAGVAQAGNGSSRVADSKISNSGKNGYGTTGDLTIESSTVSAGYVGAGNPRLVENSNIAGGARGIEMLVCNGGSVYKSEVTGGTNGIYLEGACSATIAGNTIVTKTNFDTKTASALRSVKNRDFINIYGNTFSSASGMSDLVQVEGAAVAPVLYWNNFTKTKGRYIFSNVPLKLTFYVGGHQEGNIYNNVMDGSVQVQGNATSSGYPALFVGMNGTGYPYNAATSQGKIVGTDSADTAPLTPNQYTAQAYGSLIVNASPANGGVAAGTAYNFVVPAAKPVNATANPGYTFAGWAVNGSCTIANASSASTTVTVASGTCYATAYFNATGNLIALATPPSGGAAYGTVYNFPVPATKQISATVNAGYAWAEWAWSGNCIVANQSALNTTVTVTSGTCYVYAQFNPIGSLIVNASPANGGVASGTAYNFVVPAAKPVNATANANYTFLNWGVSGSCTVANAGAASTTVTVASGTCYATAYFNYTPPAPQGCVCGALSTPNYVCNVTQDLSTSGTCFTVSAANVTILCNNHTITGNASASNPFKFGIYSSANQTVVQNCRISKFTNGISFLGADHGGIYNSEVRTDYFNAIELSNSDYNTVANSLANVSSATDAIGIGDGSFGNTITNVTAYSYGLQAISVQNSNGNAINASVAISPMGGGVQLSNASNSAINGNAITAGGTDAVSVSGTGNVIAGNTLSGTGSSPASSEIWLSSGASGTQVYWNNFTATAGFFIKDEGAGNRFNSTVGGKGEGNIYANVMNGSVQAQGNMTSSGFPALYIGVNGSGYPYSQATSQGKIIGNATDYAPLTPYYFNNSTAQGCVCGALSTPNYICNVTQNLVSNGTCFTVSATNVTILCNGHSITGMNQTGTQGISTAQAKTTVNDCIISNYETGIYFNNAVNGTISNTAAASTAAGILSNGISVWYGTGNTIINSTGTASTGNGIGLAGGAGNTVTSSKGTSTSGVAIHLDTSSGNTVINSSGNSSTNIGIMLFQSPNNRIIGSNGTSGTYVGIVISLSSNSIVTGCTGTAGTTNAGIFIQQDSNNTIANCNGISNGAGTGIYLETVTNTTIANSTARATGITGNPIDMTLSSNNLFRNNTLATGSTTNSLIRIMPNSGRNTFCLNNFTGASNYYVDDWNGSNFWNCTYAGQNQGNIYPNVMSGAVAVQGNASSVSYPQLYVGRNGTGYPYGPATSQGKMINATDYAPLTPYYFNNSTAACVCGTPLSTPNYVCNVTSDLNSIGTCFSVNATNVTILCNGHSITGTTTSGYGVYSVSAGTKVQNCIISNFSSAIYFNGADNGTIIGTAAATTATYGNAIRLENGADGNAIIGTNAASASGHGIYISSSSGNVITGSSGATLTGAGIFLSSSAGNAISNSRGTSNSGAGILVSQGAGGNTISNSNGTSNGTGDAIELSDSLNNSIANCVGASAGGEGILILYGANNIISNSKGTSATELGISIVASSGNLINNTTATAGGYFSAIGLFVAPNNTIANSVGTGASYPGIYLSDSPGGKILNSVGSASTGIGIHLMNSSGCTIFNSTGMSGSTAGIYFASSNDNNVANSTGISNAGDGFYLAGNSNNNAFTKVAGISNASFGMYIYGSSGNTVADSALASYSGKALVLSAGTNNTARNNTISSGNGLGTLLQSDSGNNTFCLNNFTATAGLYIDNYNSNNAYNCTYAGQNQGNIYANVMSGAVAVQGNVSSVGFPQLYVGRNGTGYPYSASTSQGKINGNAIDYAPLTPYYFSNATTLLQNCTCRVLSVPNTVCNVTSDMNVSGTCFNVTASNVTIKCNGHSIWGGYAPSSFGIVSYAPKTTVSGCTISGYYESGVAFNSASNGRIENTNATTLSPGGVAGILLANNANNNVVAGSAGTTLGSYLSAGIGINNSQNNTISNSAGIDSTSGGYGIYLQSGTKNAIIGSSGTSISGNGIAMIGGSNNTVTNSTAAGTASQGNTAFSIYNSNYNSLNGVIATETTLYGGGYAIRLYGSSYNVISNSVAQAPGNMANLIYIDGGSGNTISGTTAIAKGNYSNALYLDSSPGSTVANSLLSSSGTEGYAIFARNSGGSAISGTNATSSGASGTTITLMNSSGSTVANSRLISNSAICLDIFETTGVSIRNNTMTSTNAQASIIRLYDVNGSTLCLNNFTGAAIHYIDSQYSSNDYNCTYSGQNQGNIYPNVISGAVPVQGNVFSVSFPPLYVGRNGTGYPYSNTTSQGKIVGSAVDYAPLTPFYFNNGTAPPQGCVCGALNVPNYVCNMTSDLNSTGTCFNVQANNVTIQCNGHSITGIGGGTSIGIYPSLNVNALKVRNCKLNELKYGVWFNQVTSSIVENVTVNSSLNYSKGILLQASQYNTISGAKTATPHGEGIGLEGSNYNNVTSASSDSGTDGAFAVGLGSSNYNRLVNVNGTTTASMNGSNDAIVIDNSNNNVLESCIGTSNGVNGYSGAGISLAGSSNNIILNTKGIAVNDAGIRIVDGSNGNLLINCSTISSGGFYLFSSNSNVLDACQGAGMIHNSNSTVIKSSRLTANGEALRLAYAKNSIIANNTIISSAGTALAFNSDIGGQITGNNTENVIVNNTLFANMMISLDNTSSSNLFYWNNFTATSGIYVNDTAGTNRYNTTINGKPEGNIYPNVRSGAVAVQGNVSSIGFPQLFVGRNGTGYPYSANTSQGKIIGNAVDYAPLTPFYFNNSSVPPQGCVCGTPLNTPNFVCNVTQDLNSSGTCFNVQANNVTILCNGHTITGSNSYNAFGVYSTKQQTNVRGCNISGYDSGIFFNGAVNGSIQGATIKSMNYMCGIYLNSSSYITIMNSTSLSQNYYSICSDHGNHNSLINTEGTSAQWGVYMNYESNSALQNVTGIGWGSVGIGIIFGQNISVINSTGRSALNQNGIELSMTGGLISNCNSIGGIELYGNGATINNCRVNSMGTYPGISVGGSNNVIANSTVNAGNNYGIYIQSPDIHGNVFYNNTINSSAIGIYLMHYQSTGNNTFYWNSLTGTGIYIKDTTGGNFYNATINGKPEGNIYANVLSGAVKVQGNATSGYGQGLYIGSNGTGYPYSSATSQGKISGSAVDYAPLTPYYFNNTSVPPQGCVCGNLNVPNYVCNVTSDLIVAANGTCFNVTAQNVTINCKGHSITGHGNPESIGIYSSTPNTAIMNCKIAGFEQAVSFDGADYGAIRNSTLLANSTRAYMGGSGWNVPQNETTVIYGINVYNSQNVNISGVNASSIGAAGINIVSSPGATISGTNATSTALYGFGAYMFDSTDSTVMDCRFTAPMLDFISRALNQGDCTDTILNTVGSGNLPILYYNAPVTVANQEVDELILCNADNSNIQNIKAKFVQFEWTDESSIANSNVTGAPHEPLMIYFSNSNNISNSSVAGLSLGASSGNMVSNVHSESLGAGITIGHACSDSACAASYDNHVSHSASIANIESCVWGASILIEGGSSGNNISHVNASSNCNAVGIDGSSNTLDNVAAVSTAGSGIAVTGDGNGIYNSSFTSPIASLSFSGAGSSNNIFLGNRFVGNVWVNADPYGSNNVFNDSSTGNAYYFANGTGAWEVYGMVDTNGDSYADTGSDVPFSKYTVPSHWIDETGSLYDAHPYTLTVNLTNTNSLPEMPPKNDSTTIEANETGIAEQGIELDNGTVADESQAAVDDGKPGEALTDGSKPLEAAPAAEIEPTGETASVEENAPAPCAETATIGTPSDAAAPMPLATEQDGKPSQG